MDESVAVDLELRDGGFFPIDPGRARGGAAVVDISASDPA